MLGIGQLVGGRSIQTALVSPRPRWRLMVKMIRQFLDGCSVYQATVLAVFAVMTCPSNGEGLDPRMAVTSVPAAAQVVIYSGEIPKGWTPTPVACSGVGPDGRPIVVHVAPTYVFTYPAGPPVVASPPASPSGLPVVTARPVSYATAPRPSVPYGSNWVFQTQGNLSPEQGSLLTKRPQVSVAPPSSWASAPAAMPAAPPAMGPAPLPPPPDTWQPVQPQLESPPQPPVLASIPSSQESPPTLPIVPIPFVPPESSATQTVVTPSAAPVQSVSAARTWRVVGVQDGDSLTCLDEVGGQQKVVLAGIDAPEIGQDYGKQSRDALADIVFGRAVQVIEEGRDRQGRTIAKVLVDGDDINRRMVAGGMAWHYSAYSTDPDLDSLEAAARVAGRGLWSQPSPVAPWDYRRSAAADTTVASSAEYPPKTG